MKDHPRPPKHHGQSESRFGRIEQIILEDVPHRRDIAHHSFVGILHDVAALKYLVAGRQGRIEHFESMPIHSAVGVEHDQGFEVTGQDLLESPLQSEALALVIGMSPFQNMSSRLAGQLGRAIGAVIRDHKDRETLMRIIQGQAGFHYLRNRCLLVMGRNHNSEPVYRPRA